MKKNVKAPAPVMDNNMVETSEDNLLIQDDPLIQLESLDEISLFDPLKETNIKDSDVFSFLAPKAVHDSRVAELKNTIQHLTSASVSPQPPFYQSTVFFQPKVVQPGLMLPRYPGSASQLSPVNNPAMPQSNGLPPSKNSKPPIPPKETKPAIPPKTRPSSSRFFVASSELTDDDKELLNDYGLSNSPIFQGTFSDGSKPAENADFLMAAPENVLNTLDPFSSEHAGSKFSPRISKKESKVQPTWQKFT